MANLTLDHIVVAAQTLDEGHAFVYGRLGIDVPIGGEHVQMGTHNRVARLGDSAYLEIIAIAPHLDAPDRARWFDLDAPYMRDRLAAGPVLITWAARTDDIDGLRRDHGDLVGPILHMSRGELNWRISVRDDGAMGQAGLMPTVLQWPAGPHPLNAMADIGCKLVGLDLFAPNPEDTRSVLSRMGGEGQVNVHPSATGRPYLHAEINTPTGRKTL